MDATQVSRTIVRDRAKAAGDVDTKPPE